MGGGKGGGAKVSIPPQLLDIAERLTQLSEKTFAISEPGLTGGANVLQDVLKTGGSQALTPSIQQAVEQTRSAASNATRQLGEDLTRQGVTGTEAARLLGESRQAGDIAAAQTGPGIALPLVKGAAAQSLGQVSPGLSALGGAGSLLSGGITASSGGKGKGK